MSALTQDELYMQKAISLAKKGCGFVNPNPMVGAVIVKGGQIIGSGYHQLYGGLHAERNALANCSLSPEGAVMYVTLTPCCHYGRTPPCTDAIIQSGIQRVVIGSMDPNPLVGGKSVEILRQHGISVVTGLLKEECDDLNEVFFHYITTKKPFVVMKFAMSLDGKIATRTGDAKWITGDTARRHVHQTRKHLSAIMVGIGTVLADNPLLTCRIEGGKNPVRIICDNSLKIPFESQIVQTSDSVPTIIATISDDEEKKKCLQSYGITIIHTPPKNNNVDLSFLMEHLGRQNIDSILLEGGATLHHSALESGIVSKVQAYIAPILLGGEQAKTPVGGNGVPFVKDGYALTSSKIIPLENDILLEFKMTQGG